MPRPSNRETIVTAGVTVMTRDGFAGAGVRDIVAEAGVPLGCFTNHFRSKEEFGVAVLDRYVAAFVDLIAATLENPARSPLDRIEAFFDGMIDVLRQGEWRHGCLVGAMSLEAAGASEPIRARLSMILGGWARLLAGAIGEAQADGALRADLTPDDLAEFVLAGWQGAVLRMKVERSPAPLERFRRIMAESVLTPLPPPLQTETRP